MAWIFMGAKQSQAMISDVGTYPHPALKHVLVEKLLQLFRQERDAKKWTRFFATNPAPTYRDLRACLELCAMLRAGRGQASAAAGVLEHRVQKCERFCAWTMLQGTI
jgi:hypothetical protein